MLKSILSFDVKRILHYDLEGILLHPVLQLVYKATLGFATAVLLTGFLAFLMLNAVTPATERLLLVVSVALVTAFIAPDVRRLYRRQPPE